MTGMEITSLSLILFAVIIITLGIVKVHTYPGQIAARRNHPQAKAIEVCSLLGLIIFPLWMAALIWAYAGVIGTVLPEVDESESASPDAMAKDSGNSVESDQDA